jgi:hypothetical protein
MRSPNDVREENESARIADLCALIPRGRATLLDVGARDGRVSARLAPYFESITALDLERPAFELPNVVTVAGDACDLRFPDETFDVALCAEVLEHIPPERLERACREIARVAKHEVVIGVPYRQDLRVGRTTCGHCGRKNPPWGHLNVFDEGRIRALFGPLRMTRTNLVGAGCHRTNALSALLLDLAGNPWGSYSQQEPCVHCGERLTAPASRNPAEKILGRIAVRLNHVQERISAPSPGWMHVLFKKPGRAGPAEGGSGARRAAAE